MNENHGFPMPRVFDDGSKVLIIFSILLRSYCYENYENLSFLRAAGGEWDKDLDRSRQLGIWRMLVKTRGNEL